MAPKDGLRKELRGKLKRQAKLYKNIFLGSRFIKPSRPSGVNPVWPVKTKSQSASSKLKLHLTPITQREVLPNFVYLEADQMPGYEKFEKHEIVR